MKYDFVYVGAGCNPEDAEFFAQFLSTKGGVLIAPVTSAQGVSHLCLYTRKKNCTEPEDFLPVKFAGWIQCFVKLAAVTQVCFFGSSYVFLNLDSNVDPLAVLHPSKTPQNLRTMYFRLRGTLKPRHIIFVSVMCHRSKIVFSNAKDTLSAPFPRTSELYKRVQFPPVLRRNALSLGGISHLLSKRLSDVDRNCPSRRTINRKMMWNIVFRCTSWKACLRWLHTLQEDATDELLLRESALQLAISAADVKENSVQNAVRAAAIVEEKELLAAKAADELVAARAALDAMKEAEKVATAFYDQKSCEAVASTACRLSGHHALFFDSDDDEDDNA
jgi:hypothetical protein